MKKEVRELPHQTRVDHPRRHNARLTHVHDELLALAARLVVEEGLDYRGAKQRAAKALGLGARAPLPDNEVLDVAVREYLAVFCADTQPQELAALRHLALQWMQRMAAFRPHLTGAVWQGTATRLSDVMIQLFCDDPKSAEIALIDAGVRFEARNAQGLRGELVPALSVDARCADWNEGVGVHFLVLDRDDLRTAPRADAKGRPLRGDVAALQALLEA